MTSRPIISPWSDEFLNVIAAAKREVFVSSPFINEGGTKLLGKAISRKSDVHLTVLTSLTVRNIATEVTQPSAILGLYREFGQVNVASLGALHAKVYIVDGTVGVITSANLTSGGLRTNFEYGVHIDDPEIVRTMTEDMKHYYDLGNILDRMILERLAEKAQGLQTLKMRAENALQGLRWARKIKQTTEEIETELLRNRVRDGKTVNGILCETILYLLKTKGPLVTRALHRYVQGIHPDICDDSIDRVINGEHFGKKWKHQVRNAQQHLKRMELIELEGEKWRIANPGTG